ncbi:MAG: hexose kinase [Bacillus sp. (in: firmicutes)]
MIYTVTLNTAIDRILYVENQLTRKKNNVINSIGYDIGGKATHVSVVLAKMKIDNIATGFIGEHHSALLLSMLQSHQVKSNFIVQKGCRTRESTVIVDDSGNGSFMMTEKGFEISESSHIKLVNYLQENVKKGDLIVFAGSPPSGYSIDNYRQLLETVTKKGGLLVIDAAKEFLREAIKQKPYLIKPNEDELNELIGKSLTKDHEYIEEIIKLHQKGVEVVVISLGKKGSFIGFAQQYFKVTPPVVEEVNDTGCGDAFVGGMVAGLTKDTEDILNAVRFATAVSALKATQKTSSIPSLHHIDEWMEAVQIERIGEEE